MYVYIILLFSLIISIILTSLLFYLTLRKFKDNLRAKQILSYKNKIQPIISTYISKGDNFSKRVLQTRNTWKQKVIIDFLYNEAILLKNKDELERVKLLADKIGLTKELKKKLLDKRWWIVADATRKAGKLHLNELEPIILKNLYSDNYDIWTASARALTQMGKAQHLVNFLIKNENKLKKWSIVRIGDMLMHANSEDLKLVIDKIENASSLLKAIFIEIFGRNKITSAVPAIENYLDDSNFELRLKALKALGEIGITSRENKIISLLSGDNWTEVVMAIRAVESCNIRQAIPKLTELISNRNWWIRLKAAKALSSFGAVGIDKLKSVSLNHEDLYARDMAVKVLQEQKFEVSS